MQKSPLAVEFPHLPPIDGVRLSAVAAGIKYARRDDLMLAAFAPTTKVAGVFTRSSMCSAAVDWCRAALKGQSARGLIVNAGNANTFTGAVGQKHVVQTANSVAAKLGCVAAEVFVASTGVIGEFLPIVKIVDNITPAAEALADTAWQAAAEAILTTDTFAKGATCSLALDGVAVTINGFAKGSGMIEPDMATMLAFIFTDANVEAGLLQQMLVAANNNSFNAITIDGDTSTNDTCLFFATASAGHEQLVDIDDPRAVKFQQCLNAVMTDLAQQVVRDGEGATKFIAVTVTGAVNQKSARVIAKAIANSPLVKTAIAGEDANWGRVVMAVGKSGAAVRQRDLQIKFGGVLITRDGQPVADYDESLVAAHLQQHNILLQVEVGIGAGAATVWTCDLTHGYIAINADYRS